MGHFPLACLSPRLWTELTIEWVGRMAVDTDPAETGVPSLEDLCNRAENMYVGGKDVEYVLACAHMGRS